MQTGYIMNVTGSSTLGLIKLSIFLFYLDIFWPLHWCRWAIYIGASLSSMFYLSMTIVQYYYMTPRPGETMSKHYGGRMAAKQTKFSIPTSSVGLAIDVVLLVIPLLAVFQLQMANKKKVRICLTFLVGIMYVESFLPIVFRNRIDTDQRCRAVIGSILSLSFKVKTYGNPDLTYHLILVNFFM